MQLELEIIFVFSMPFAKKRRFPHWFLLSCFYRTTAYRNIPGSAFELDNSCLKGQLCIVIVLSQCANGTLTQLVATIENMELHSQFMTLVTCRKKHSWSLPAPSLPGAYNLVVKSGFVNLTECIISYDMYWQDHVDEWTELVSNMSVAYDQQEFFRTEIVVKNEDTRTHGSGPESFFDTRGYWLVNNTSVTYLMSKPFSSIAVPPGEIFVVQIPH